MSDLKALKDEKQFRNGYITDMKDIDGAWKTEINNPPKVPDQPKVGHRYPIKDLNPIFEKHLLESNSAFNRQLAKFLIQVKSRIKTVVARHSRKRFEVSHKREVGKGSVKQEAANDRETISKIPNMGKLENAGSGHKSDGRASFGANEHRFQHQDRLKKEGFLERTTKDNSEIKAGETDTDSRRFRIQYPHTDHHHVDPLEIQGTRRRMISAEKLETIETRGSAEGPNKTQLISGVIIFLMVIFVLSTCTYYAIRCCRFNDGPETEFHIDFSHLKPIQRLGRGNFTDVYLVDYQQSDSETVKAAAKLLVPEILNQDGPSVLADSIRCSVDEIILRKLKHKNIVKIYGICTNFEIPAQISASVQGTSARKYKTIATVLEYMKLGNCEHFFHLRSGIRQLENPVHVLFLILLDVISAFIYLGHHHIVHRDLAARNILLTLTDNDDHTIKNRLVAKVADFGLAKKGEKSPLRKFWAYIGSGHENLDERIMAPEAKAKALYSSASDVYAFGMFILVLIEYASTCKSEQGALVEDVEDQGQPKLDGNIQPITPCGYSSVIPIIISVENNNVAAKEIYKKRETYVKRDLQMVANLCLESDMDRRITFKELEQIVEILAAKYRGTLL